MPICIFPLNVKPFVRQEIALKNQGFTRVSLTDDTLMAGCENRFLWDRRLVSLLKDFQIWLIAN